MSECDDSVFDVFDARPELLNASRAFRLSDVVTSRGGFSSECMKMWPWNLVSSPGLSVSDSLEHVEGSADLREPQLPSCLDRSPGWSHSVLADFVG